MRPPKPEEEAHAETCQRPEAGRARLRPSGLPAAGARPGRRSRATCWTSTTGSASAHAAEYNRSWDFFAGMTEGQIRARQARTIVTGGRPTWSFQASRALARGGRAQASTGFFRDPFGLFAAAQPPAPSRPRTTASWAGSSATRWPTSTSTPPPTAPAIRAPLHRAGQALPPGRQRRRPLGRAQAPARDQGLPDPAQSQSGLIAGVTRRARAPLKQPFALPA